MVLLTAFATLGCTSGDGGTDPDFVAPFQNLDAPAALAFQSQPLRTAGTTVPNLQVAILNQKGQVATGATKAVTIAIANNPGGATLSGTTTVNPVNGVATFNTLSLDRVGTGYTFEATSPGLTPATSNPFNITAAAAGQVTFLVPPSGVTAGLAITPPIQVETRDAFGNLADTTVTLTIGNNPSGGTLGGSTRLMTVNGVATFAGITVSQGGAGYTLVATADTGANATSGLFNVSARFLAADAGNNRLAQFDDFTGTGWTTLATAGQTHGVARDAQGRIYFTDFVNETITRVDDITGANPSSLGSAGGGVNQLNDPLGIAFDNQGRILIADANNNRIVRIDDITGANWTTLGGFASPTNVAVDAQGRIYVSDFLNNRVVRVDDMVGANLTSYNLGSRPYDVEVDASGRIYIIDINNNRIVRIDDMAGSNFVTFGSFGNGVNQFNNPAGLSLNQSGQIYVSDQLNNRVVRFDDMTGANWATFGTGGGGVNQFLAPYDLLAD